MKWNRASFLKMGAILMGLLTVALGAYADVIVDQTFSVDITPPGGTYEIDGASAAWTINPGITVDGFKPFYIDYLYGGLASVFTVKGGGTLKAGNMRLGWVATSGTGTVIVAEGSTLRCWGAIYESGDGGGIELNDVGTTLEVSAGVAPILVDGAEMITCNMAHNVLLTTPVLIDAVNYAQYVVDYVQTNFTVNTTLSDNQFLEGTAVTWTISPGVTVSNPSTMYLETNVLPDGGATFTVAGGGTFLGTHATGVRFGHLVGNGIGKLIIEGGSTVWWPEVISISGDGGEVEINQGTLLLNTWYDVDIPGSQITGLGGAAPFIPVLINGQTLGASGATADTVNIGGTDYQRIYVPAPVPAGTTIIIS